MKPGDRIVRVIVESKAGGRLKYVYSRDPGVVPWLDIANREIPHMKQLYETHMKQVPHVKFTLMTREKYF